MDGEIVAGAEMRGTSGVVEQVEGNPVFHSPKVSALLFNPIQTLTAP